MLSAMLKIPWKNLGLGKKGFSPSSWWKPWACSAASQLSWGWNWKQAREEFGTGDP